MNENEIDKIIHEMKGIATIQRFLTLSRRFDEMDLKYRVLLKKYFRRVNSLMDKLIDVLKKGE